MRICKETNEIFFEIVYLFSGLGGLALGAQSARHEYKGVTGRFRTVVGIDVDADACKDFEKLTGAPSACMDLFSREQYIAFHGKEPDEGWKEVTPQDIRELVLRLNEGRNPDGIFLSPPCKGFSGLLSEEKAASEKYQALNGLVDRSIWLVMEAFKDDPIALILMENVPRITSRGAAKLSQIKNMLKSYGYEINMDTHDAGELGGLSQIRKRFLLIARDPRRIPSFIYKPQRHRVKSIGELLDTLPMPGDVESAGEMHRIPRLQWNVWVRLALIPPGEDWRALKDSEYALGHSPRSGSYKIIPYDEPSNTVTSFTSGIGQSNGASAVADPRIDNVCGYGNKYRVIRSNEPCTTVTGSRIGSGAQFIADDRIPRFANLYRVIRMDEPSATVTGGAGPSNGALSVADTRIRKWSGAGNYEVQRWDMPGKCVTCGDIHSGASAVGDPRIPDSKDKGVYVIVSESATWNRPLTTFELAMLQGLPSRFPDGSPLVLTAKTDTKRREHIGNMVPPAASAGFSKAILETIMPNYMGDWYWGSSEDGIWVNKKIHIPDTLILM